MIEDVKSQAESAPVAKKKNQLRMGFELMQQQPETSTSFEATFFNVGQALHPSKAVAHKSNYKRQSLWSIKKILKL